MLIIIIVNNKFIIENDLINATNVTFVMNLLLNIINMIILT